MARKSPPTHRGKPLSRYLDRAHVEAEYTRNLDTLTELLAHRVAAGQSLAAILQLARDTLSRGTTSPEIYRAVSDAVRIYDRDLGYWEGEAAASEVAVTGEILCGALIVDPYTGDFIEPGEPYGSKKAWKTRNAARLAKAKAAAGVA